MKLIFFGSDDFAAVHLKALVASSHDVVACVTQPDRPKGRGMKVLFSPIKDIALEHKIPLLQPEHLKSEDIISRLKGYQADFFVVIAYGQILSTSVLSIPKFFAINVHTSLLPKYRGAAPINWAIINGDEESGVTIIKMNAALDAGEIVSQQKVKIDAQDTSVSLREKMMAQGPQVLLKTIEDLSRNHYTLKGQDAKFVTQAPKLTKELGKINWGQPARTIHNLVRGLLPWPGAYTDFKGKRLKVLVTDLLAAKDVASPGEIVSVNKQGIVVSTGSGNVLLKSVHLESSKPMDAYNFVIGHQLKKGFIFP